MTGPERESQPSTAAASSIEVDANYLIYLHARIIEEQGLPAVSPEHGEYQYERILQRFRDEGFMVISELRPAKADSRLYADRTVARIRELLDAGVAPNRITIVGASKGAYIAALVSDALDHAELRYVLLAMCDAETVAYLRAQGVTLNGDVLAIRDFADTELAGPCAPLFADADPEREHREIVVDVGSAHGILFRPLDAWVLPTLQFARRKELSPAQD